MTWFTGIIVFLLTWWMVIFTVLPFGLKRNPDGTPESPQLKKKILITTAISILLWLVIYALIEADVISFREMAQNIGEE